MKQIQKFDPDTNRYEAIKESEISNRIVKEFNASVCTKTFHSTTGTQKADLYSNPNSVNTLVAHNTCPPIDSTFIKTINIYFR